MKQIFSIAFLICIFLFTFSNAECDSDDSYEDNDSISVPKELTFGNHSGLIVCAASSDFYLVNISQFPENFIVRITISFPKGQPLDVTVYDINNSILGNTIAQEGDNTVDIVVSNNSAIILNVQYFRWTGGDPIPYELIMSSFPLPPCTADRYDGSHSKPGFPIEFGSINSVSICKYSNSEEGLKKEFDYYNIKVPANTFIKISVFRFNVKSSPLTIKVYDEENTNQEILAYQHYKNLSLWTLGFNSGNEISTAIIEISMDGPGEWETRYKLTVEKMFICGTDKLEPNNNFQLAKPLSVGTYIGDLNLCGADQDFFRMKLEKGGANIHFQFGDEAPSIMVTITNELNDLPLLSVALDDVNHWVYFYAESDGNYDIKISPIESFSYGNDGNYTYGIALCQPKHNCFQRRDESGCDDVTIESCVCNVIDHCCSNSEDAKEWGIECEQQAGSFCNGGCQDLIPDINYASASDPIIETLSLVSDEDQQLKQQGGQKVTIVASVLSSVLFVSLLGALVAGFLACKKSKSNRIQLDDVANEELEICEQDLLKNVEVKEIEGKMDTIPIDINIDDNPTESIDSRPKPC